MRTKNRKHRQHHVPGKAQIRAISKKVETRNLAFLTTIFAFGLLGTLLLFRSFAAGPWESLQPEGGIQSGNVTVVADAGASGGSYISFGGSIAGYTKLEAEAAQHNVQVVNLNGTSGNKVLGYFYQTGSYVTFSVNAPSSGSYTARLRYNAALNETGQPGTLTRTLLINNQQVATPSFALTTNTLNNWGDPGTYQTKDLGALSLNQGNNTITLRIDATAYPWDVDYLEIAGASSGVTPNPPPPGPTPPPGGSFTKRKCTSSNIPGTPVYINSGGNLRAALTALQPGQTLVIGPGTYQADVDMGSRSNITICANPTGGRPLLYGGIGFSGASNVHIEGLELNGNGTSIGGITFSWGSTNMSAWDNWAHNFDQCGICAARAGGKIDISHNRIWDNSHTSCYGGSGISLWAFDNGATGNDANGYNTYIVGNVLWDNYQSVPSTCIGADYITDGNCIIIDVMDGSQTSLGGSPEIFQGAFLVANNTCSHNGGRCIQSFGNYDVDIYYNSCYQNGTEIAVNQSHRVRIKNNIIVGNNTYSEYASTGLEFADNIWSGGSASVRGSGDIVADPLFTNPQANASLGDWRPRSGSPAIGAATPLPQVLTDTSGKTRPSSPTIGAWEP